MRTTVASLVLFAAAAFAQGNLTINTPTNVVACEPTQLTWIGGTPPYFLSVLPGSSPSGSPLESFSPSNSTSFTWTCNIAPSSYIGFTLRDSNGLVAQTAPVTVISGSSTSCVNITGAPGPTSAGSSSSATVAATTTTAGTSGSSGGTTPSSPSSTSTSTSNNGASANAAQFGVAGLVGVAVAALFL
ncbi:hypothetical protein V8E55_003531 [Tylopilus felleus]